MSSSRVRVAAASVLALAGSLLAAAVATAPSATAANTPGKYSVTLAQASVPAGAPATVLATVKNNGGSLVALGSASITLPTSVSAISVPSTVTNSARFPWSASVVGKTVRLKVKSPLGIGVLLGGQSVTVPITLTASTPGTFNLATGGWLAFNYADLLPFFSRTGPAPALTVTASNSESAACPSNDDFETNPDGCSIGGPDGVLTGSQPGDQGQNSVYGVAAAAGEQPAVVTGSVDIPEPSQRLLCQTVDFVLTFDVSGNRAKTVREVRENPATDYVCYGSPSVFGVVNPAPGLQPPVTADFNPATGMYEGILEECSVYDFYEIDRTNLPCVTQNLPDEFNPVRFIEVYAPPGDPRFTN